MNDRKLDFIEWVESHNGVDFDCKLQVAKHTGNPSNIFLIIPGVDGSLDGFDNKYLKIASLVNQEAGHTVYQMDNPYISRLHWESNVRQMLDYIFMEHPDVESINIMAHSAGAWVIGKVAHEYPEIKRVLMVNPATNIDIDAFKSNIDMNKHTKFVFMIGSQDPSHEHLYRFTNRNSKIVIIDGADHNFSGEHLNEFITAPIKHLF